MLVEKVTCAGHVPDHSFNHLACTATVVPGYPRRLSVLVRPYELVGHRHVMAWVVQYK
jgi:hypothetical protein